MFPPPSWLVNHLMSCDSSWPVSVRKAAPTSLRSELSATEMLRAGLRRSALESPILLAKSRLVTLICAPVSHRAVVLVDLVVVGACKLRDWYAWGHRLREI